MMTRPMLLLLAALLSACGPAPTTSESSKREPAERDQALNRAIQAPQDKARAVEQQLQEDQRRKREAIDEASGG